MGSKVYAGYQSNILLELEQLFCDFPDHEPSRTGLLLRMLTVGLSISFIRIRRCRSSLQTSYFALQD